MQLSWFSYRTWELWTLEVVGGVVDEESEHKHHVPQLIPDWWPHKNRGTTQRLHEEYVQSLFRLVFRTCLISAWCQLEIMRFSGSSPERIVCSDKQLSSWISLSKKHLGPCSKGGQEAHKHLLFLRTAWRAAQNSRSYSETENCRAFAEGWCLAPLLCWGYRSTVSREFLNNRVTVD